MLEKLYVVPPYTFLCWLEWKVKEFISISIVGFVAKPTPVFLKWSRWRKFKLNGSGFAFGSGTTQKVKNLKILKIEQIPVQYE